jgi:eukaryotic-like serine/threonine-protein kinase
VLTSGHLLAERYRLGRRIAVGGMGEVWDAVDVRLDRPVAVKVLKSELCGDAEFLHRFRTEARTTASLNHPGIAAVHDYGETAAIPDGPQDTAYLVMELVEGVPLAAILAREGRIHVDYTLDLLEQAGNALQAAHDRGLVHRDVKPGNILIGPNGTVKLTDFGIAKAVDAAPVTRSGMVMGTAHYIAPEQALGGEATPASDVYSLAVVGYECLMGHRPFLSDNAVTVAMMHIREVAPPLPPGVPPGARALIEATLVKDPRRRYATGGEFAAAVSKVRAGLPLPPPAALAMSSRQPPQHMTMGIPNTGGIRVAPNPPITPGPVTQGIPPANTYPPGVIGPVAPATRPARSPRWSIWVLVAIIVVLVLVVIGLLTWYMVVQHGRALPVQPHVRPLDDVAMVSLDSPDQVGHTALGDPLIVDSPGRLGRPVQRSAHGVELSPHLTAPIEPTIPGLGGEVQYQPPWTNTVCRAEAGTTAQGAVTRRARQPRIGTMGRSWTRIGTTHR